MNTVTLDGFKAWSDLEVSTTYFIRDLLVKIMFFAGCLTLTDLTNALKRGATVRCFAIYRNIPNPQSDDEGEHLIRHYFYGREPRGIIDAFSRLEFKTDSVMLDDVLHVCKRSYPSIRAFSPFALDRLKPIKTPPAKWTLAHVKRLLANGQYTGLRCDGVYTDDYAADADADFRRGSIDGTMLLSELVSSPSGWWVHERDGRLYISCHHFNNNSLIATL